MNIRLLFLLIFLLQSACSNQPVVYAPVSDGTLIDPLPKNGIHHVKKGESLYSIAWRYGLDHHQIASNNHLTHVHSGENIYLSRPTKLKHKQTHALVFHEPTSSVKVWHWPAKGPVIGNFSNLNKGINIAGRVDDPIYAAARGKVVYSGKGLRGYGNLIIIDHNKSYLTAYAHNKINLVKEGQMVKSSQKIALMGNSCSRKVMLHFEIRKDGKPVNPLIILNSY